MTPRSLDAARQRILSTAGDLPGAAPLDSLAATFALILLSPVLAIVGLAIWLTDGRPFVYAHRRVGLHGREFDCLKFRTMASDGDRILAEHLRANPQAALEWEATRKLADDPRVTPLGRFLRAASLDELPQLVNVLRGEMVVVGPRPIVRAEAKKYGRHFGAYCSVRPGLTGLWQVSGRSDLSYAERVALDVRFVRERSAKLYAYILWRTIPAVLGRVGSR